MDDVRESMDAGKDREVLLHMRDIVKTFPGVRALDGVDLDVRAGEVHCLLGQNGGTCDAIAADGAAGTYGSVSFCDPSTSRFCLSYTIPNTLLSTSHAHNRTQVPTHLRAIVGCSPSRPLRPIAHKLTGY